MVDTGFNLFLTLPSSLIAALGLPICGSRKGDTRGWQYC